MKSWERFIENYKGYSIYVYDEYSFFYYMIKNSKNNIIESYIVSRRAAKIRITNLTKTKEIGNMSEEELELHSINIKDRKYYSQYIIDKLQQENEKLKEKIKDLKGDK